jgi:hypothetical protein
MNPGISEEVGKTTRSFFEVMKEEPALMILALANFALIIFIFVALYYASTFRTTLIAQNFAYQKQVADILSRCVVTR